MTGGTRPRPSLAEAFVEQLALLSLSIVEAARGGTDRQREQLDAGLIRLEAEAADEPDLLAYVGRLRAVLGGDTATTDEPFPIPGPYAAMWAEVRALLHEVS